MINKIKHVEKTPESATEVEQNEEAIAFSGYGQACRYAREMEKKEWIEKTI